MDRSFNEFHVIICRNVMIYFERGLQERVHELFDESLARLGILALGRQGVAAHDRARATKLRGARRGRADLPEGEVVNYELVVVGGLVGRDAGSRSRARRARRRLPGRRSSSPASRSCGRDRLAPTGAALHAAAGARGRGQGRLVPGNVYLAPSDYHMLVEAEGTLGLSTEERVRYARPSIDVLFRSAAEAYRERCVGVVLTGANEDGADGLRRIKELGGVAVVQDPGRPSGTRCRPPRSPRRRGRRAAAQGDRPVPARPPAGNANPQPRLKQSRRWDSNPRRPLYKSGALPAELLRRCAQSSAG